MKTSELARQIYPYLLPMMARGLARAIASSGGGNRTITVEQHALSGDKHTGTLTNAQGPQFLLKDGTRALQGNLSVDAGITIDGVDLDVHAANPDAHHQRATAGNGISVSASQQIAVELATNPGLEFGSGKLKVLPEPTGGLGLSATGLGIRLRTVSGLSISSGLLHVVDGFGLIAATDGLHVHKAAHSGLEFDGSDGSLKLGTPSTLTYQSTSAVNLATHSHAIDTSADVGTTPAAKILRSTTAGGLILGTLNVKGSVDVTNGGDLTVGANVLFVDVSLQSVGIMRAPDPQFALDVNGPIRGTELIGKHAIQLSDVELLCHYDGGAPYESNFTGVVTGHRGQVPLEQSVLHFRPGKFYKSVVLAQGGTNFITNPSFEVGLSNWGVDNPTGGNLSMTRVTDEFWYGAACARLTWTTIGSGTGSVFYSTNIGPNGAGTFVASAWMRANQNTSVVLSLAHDTTGVVYGNVLCNLTEEWQRFSVICPALPVNAQARIVIAPLTAAARTVWVDAVQVENTPQPTPYIDGTLGSGYAWSGVANASQSTRGSSLLSYTLDNMVRHRWSVMTWVRFAGSTPTANRGLLALSGPTGMDVSVYLPASTAGVQVQITDSTGISYQAFTGTAIVPEQDYHVAVVYDNGTLRGYWNGALAFTTTADFSSAPSIAYVGRALGLAYGNLMIDDFVVVQTALTTERVKAIYESDAPVFAESSIFTFRATPRGLVWADEEGLWMRDVDGNAVMGFYGGEAALKSWGGLSLARGDILFGRYGVSDGGWLLFDRDGVSSKPYLSLGYSDKTVIAFDANGASLDGVLDVGVNGGIWQGTGSFTSPNTGLRIWNQSGLGRIGGYNAGTLQWYADTDGKLKAGGGNVVLDSGGILVDDSSSSAAVHITPTGGVTIDSAETWLLDLNSVSPVVSAGFGGITIEHVLQTGYLSLGLTESGTKHQGILALANSFSPNETELVIQAQTHESTNENNDARIELQVVAHGVTNDFLASPYIHEMRMELSARNGLNIIGAPNVMIDGSAIVARNMKIYGDVYNNVAVSIPNNLESSITFNSEYVDPTGMHSTSSNTNRMTAPIAGDYLVIGNAAFSANGTGERVLILRANGTTVFAYADRQDPSPAALCAFGIVGTVTLAAGGYVEMRAYQNSGGALSIARQAEYSPKLAMFRIVG